MARRRSKAKTQRRKKQAVNLLSIAQTYANTAIITRAAFRTNPIEFLTGNQTLTATTYKTIGGVRTATGTRTTEGYQPIHNGTALTLPEIFGRNYNGKEILAGGYSIHGNGGTSAFMEAVKENISLNGGYLVPVVQTIGVNAGFMIAKKLLSKQRRVINKGFKMAGLRSDVMV